MCRLPTMPPWSVYRERAQVGWSSGGAQTLPKEGEEEACTHLGRSHGPAGAVKARGAWRAERHGGCGTAERREPGTGVLRVCRGLRPLGGGPALVPSPTLLAPQKR